MGETLRVGVRHERGYPIATAVGEIDIAAVTLLRRRLFDLAASGRPLVVELDQVSFIDSAGIGALVGAAKRAAEYGGSLSVVCAQPKIWRLFRLVGVDSKIPLAHSLDEALEKLGGGPDHTRLISSSERPPIGHGLRSPGRT